MSASKSTKPRKNSKTARAPALAPESQYVRIGATLLDPGNLNVAREGIPFPAWLRRSGDDADAYVAMVWLVVRNALAAIRAMPGAHVHHVYALEGAHAHFGALPDPDAQRSRIDSLEDNVRNALAHLEEVPERLIDAEGDDDAAKAAIFDALVMVRCARRCLEDEDDTEAPAEVAEPGVEGEAQLSAAAAS